VPRAVVSCPSCAQRVAVETDATVDARCTRCGCAFRPDLTLVTILRDDARTPPTDAPALFGEPPPALRVGDVLLDLYEVVSLLGKGGLGEVYRVRHRGWLADLAVKCPRAAIAGDPDARALLVREAETWINLELHPHVASCYYVRSIDGLPRIFAEYADGGSLTDWLRSSRLYQGEGALARMLDVAIQVAWGLHHAHEHGIIHQDVKSSNVLMTADGVARVTDFGMAKARGLALTRTRTRTPGESALVSVGGMTPAYCSPEQADGRPLSRRTDVWSLGVTILEMFCGSIAWQTGPLAGEALAEFRASAFPDPRLPKMPDALADLLQRCLAPQADARPHTMLDVANELRAIHASAIGRPHARPEPRPRKLLADGLNNRAVSLLDLGSTLEAEKRWEEALAADPHHLHATFNRGLYLWRRGRLTDDALLRRLREARASHRQAAEADALIGLVERERGEGFAERPPIAAHAAPITAAALAGNVVVSSARDGSLRAWNAANGRALAEVAAHVGPVNGLAASPDGRLAITGGADKLVRAWKLPLLAADRTLAGHESPVSAVALDERRAISGAWDGAIRVWDLAAGRCARVLREHRDTVNAVAIGAGDVALSAGVDGTLRVWNLSTGVCTHVMEARATAIAMTGDARLAFTADADHAIRVWDLEEARCIRTLAGHGDRPLAVAATPDGRRACSGGRDRTVRVWDVVAGRCVRTLEGHADAVTAVAVSADGRLAVSGSADRALRAWELPKTTAVSPFVVARPRAGDELAAGDARLSELAERVRTSIARGNPRAAATAAAQARALPGYERSPEALALWAEVAMSTARGELRDAWELRSVDAGACAVALSADGRCALTGGDGPVRVWDVGAGRAVRALDGAGALSVALSDDGRLALAACADGVRAYAVDDERLLWGEPGTAVAITPDGRLALVAGPSAMRVVDMASGRALKSLPAGARAVALSPDGQHAVADGRVWHLPSAAELRAIEGIAFAFSRDGKLVASGDPAGRVRLWNAATGGCVRSFEGHAGAATAVALSADAQHVLSAGDDRTIRLWSLAHGKCMRTLEGHGGAITGLAWSDDLRTAVSVARDRTLRAWAIDWHLVAREPARWDERARAWLDAFVAGRRPLLEDGLTRRGAPSWTDADVEDLLVRLRRGGYGWLRADGVKAELARVR